MTSIKFRALTHNDHKLFFEALGEYGKDFQNIQQYMVQKCGKSSNKSSDQNKSIDPQERRDQDKKEEDKKREQIRNFYNKLYAKLSQLIGKLDDRVEKVNQELYLLINYGEIWKKHGFKFNNKTKKLLEELVHQGFTTLRFKNKNVRLRTPPCKALKKINEIGIDEKVKVVTSRELPKDVVVEFHPATNRDWIKVQSISQNPLVRGKLPIQKRLSNILAFLENKWNISPDKLNRTVDSWLKVPTSNKSSEDPHNQQWRCINNNPIGNPSNGNVSSQLEVQSITTCQDVSLNHNHITSSSGTHVRVRLKPSAQHELKEVNITRVVPDNHLDLSLNAYINRLGETVSKCEQSNKNSVSKDISANLNISHISSNGGMVVTENLDHSLGGMSSSSRLPISLTTPDSSILFEKSCTSDQPSIAQARKHLNLLQSLTESIEGCENSRTACEDTMSVLFNDEALPPSSLLDKAPSEQLNRSASNHDSQNSKSVDFHIPENTKIIDWARFKMSDHGDGDDANDAFPITIDDSENIIEDNDNDNEDNINDNEDNNNDNDDIKSKADPICFQSPQNHMIELKKLAQGWTRQDESSMTIGELYLAFKCPEKIVLEYEFENFIYSHMQGQDSEDLANNITIIPESPSNTTLIFKLLTAASLSLAHIEQQHKIIEQPGAKLKRKKGQSQAMTLHDTEATAINQRVEEALKQLQPTRLSVFRRAR